MSAESALSIPAMLRDQLDHATGVGSIAIYLDELDVHHLHQLLVRTGSGDQHAFEEYYQLTSPVLAALVAARGLPAATADAVLVEVYVAIWRHAGGFAGSGHSLWQWTLTHLTQALPAPTRYRRRRPRTQH